MSRTHCGRWQGRAGPQGIAGADESQHGDLALADQRTAPSADPGLRIGDHLVVKPLGPDSTFQDVLIFASRKEQRSYQLYRDLAEKAEGQARDVLEAMSKDELRHKNLAERCTKKSSTKISSMRQIITALDEAVQRNEPVALATIVEVKGASPAQTVSSC